MATLFGFMFGAIWYSPKVFLHAWLMGNKMTKDEVPKRSALYTAQINVYSFLAHGCMATVLALLFEIIQVSSYKVAVSLGLLIALGFVVTVQFIEMVYAPKGVHYEKSSQIKFLVASGYYLGTIAIMSLIIFYFACKQQL